MPSSSSPSPARDPNASNPGASTARPSNAQTPDSGAVPSRAPTSPASLPSLQRVSLPASAQQDPPELTVSYVADTLVDSAQTVVERRFRILLLIRDAYDRLASDAPALRSVLSDLSAMLRLLYAWANASYQRVPWPTLMMVAGAVGYFVLPLDLIPDMLGPIGLMDDAAIIASTVQSVRDELDRFRKWEMSGGAISEGTQPDGRGAQSPRS